MAKTVPPRQPSSEGQGTAAAPDGMTEAEIDYLRRFINCSVFSPPPEEVNRAHAVLTKILANREDGLKYRKALREGPVAWVEHHKGGSNLSWDRVDHHYAKATPLYALEAE